jgi:hypothetical protein
MRAKYRFEYILNDDASITVTGVKYNAKTPSVDHFKRQWFRLGWASTTNTTTGYRFLYIDDMEIYRKATINGNTYQEVIRFLRDDRMNRLLKKWWQFWK